jgi:hypothetical protein
MRSIATGTTALALASLLAACSAPPRAAEADLEAPPAAAPPAAPAQRTPPPPSSSPMSYERGPSEPFSFKNVTLDAEWIPAMWVTTDIDDKGTAATRAELDTGSGVALRAGLGSNQQNIGLLYMGTWHDEKTTGRGASTQSLLLDFLYRAPIPEMNNQVWFEVDAGLGGTDLEFDSDQIDSKLTGSALLHGDLEFRITRAFTVAAGFGGFIWGDPGDTVAYGTYVTLGVKLLF